MDFQTLRQLLAPVFTDFTNLNNVYLFGSRANNTAYPESDYDFALLLSPFDPQEIYLPLTSLLQDRLEEILESAVDVIIMQQTSIPFQFRIIKEGIVIFCRNENLRTDLEDRIIRDYLDFKPFLDQYDREAKETIEEGDFFA